MTSELSLSRTTLSLSGEALGKTSAFLHDILLYLVQPDVFDIVVSSPPLRVLAYPAFIPNPPSTPVFTYTCSPSNQGSPAPPNFHAQHQSTSNMLYMDRHMVHLNTLNSHLWVSHSHLNSQLTLANEV